jgi:O-antigen ligase
VAFSKYRYTFAAGFIITIPIIWVSLSQDLKNRYLTIVDPSVGPANAEESAESRQEFFWKAVEIWEKNPVLGVGPACFSIASSTHAQAHTLYGQILSELGTLGAIAFAILLWAFFVNWRCAKLLTANIPTLRSTIEYRLVIAVTVTVGLLLFMGLGGHNLFRYTWLWYGAFLAIAVRQITIRYSTADIRLPNSADTCINYLQFDLLT